MVSLLGLLDLGKMSGQVLLVEECGAVNPLEHLLVGVSLPVGAGDREELEGADLTGMRDVGPAAEVDELPLPVEAEDAVFVELVVDMFDLVSLPQVVDELPGLGHGHAEPLERLGLLDDPGHLGFDGRKIILGQGPRGQIDVVVKPALGGRSEGEPAPGKIRRIARAMMCAVECRRTSSASRSREVRIRSSTGAPLPSSRPSGRSRSTTAPSATAATAASASRRPIPSATSREEIPSGHSLTDPSGSLIWTIVALRPLGRPSSSRSRSGLPPTHNAGTERPADRALPPQNLRCLIPATKAQNIGAAEKANEPRAGGRSGP